MTAPAIDITSMNADGTADTFTISPADWKYEQLVCLAVCAADDGEAEFYIDGQPLTCEQARDYLFVNAHGKGTFDYDADNGAAEARARAGAAKALAEFIAEHGDEYKAALLTGDFEAFAKKHPVLLAVATVLDPYEMTEIGDESMKLDSTTVLQIAFGIADRAWLRDEQRGIDSTARGEDWLASALREVLRTEKEQVDNQRRRDGLAPLTDAEFRQQSRFPDICEKLSRYVWASDAALAALVDELLG